MKLNTMQKIRLAYRRAFDKKNIAKVSYKKKSDDQVGSYFIDMNFIEDNGSTFNTYSFASGAKYGGIRTFYKDRIQKLELC